MNCVLKHKPRNNSSSFLQGCFLWFAEIYCFKPEISSERTSVNIFLNCNFNFILLSFFIGISICYSINYRKKFGMISEPNRPEGPLVIGNIDANSVHLSWKPPLEDNGGPILGYVIEAKDVLLMDVRKTYVWSDGPKTEHLVQDLDTGHIYQFRVYAQNEAGRSEGLLNKSLVRIKAKSKKPPKPSKPSAEMLGENSVLLKWSIMEDTGNLNYLVERYEPKSDLWFSCNRQMVITPSYLVTGLSSDREYIFRVSSENAHGVSLPSETSDPIKWEVDVGEAPFIILPLKDCFIQSNESAFFKCEYTGTRPIQVNWTKDDIRIREGLGSVITSDDIGKSELTLHDVDSDDDDCTIQCSLQNAFGKKSSEAAIRILCIPQLLYPSSYKEDLTFDCGDALRLKVTFAGKPPPICKWFFNDKDPLLSDRISVTQFTNSLEIRIQDLTADDSGVYTIIVSNDMGEDSIDVRVIITGPPEAPNGHLKFVIVDDESCFLTWDPPLNDGGSEIFNYVVEKKLFEEEIWSRYGITHKNSLNLGDSKEIEGYVFRVRATNIYGTSDPSKECRCQKTCFDENTDKSSLQSLNNQDQEEKSTIIQFYDGVPPIREIDNLKQEQFEQNKANRTELESVVVLESDDYHEEDLIDASKDIHINDIIEMTFTLLKNFCSSYTELFSEVANFASEESYPICCPTFELQCDIFYRTQFLDTPLETVNYLLEVEYIPMNYFFSWIVHENALEVYEPLCFLAISQQTHPLDLSKLFLQNQYLGKNEASNTFLYFTVQNEENHSNYFQKFSIPYKLHHSSNSIVIFHPPLILEDVQLFEVQQHQEYQCNISVIPCISVQISVDNSIETLQDSGTCYFRGFSKAIIRYHSFEDFEDIISLCSTPVRTWKPALSVLPIKRETTTACLLKESFPGLTVTNPFDNPKTILKGLPSHKKSENEIHAKLENILPTKAIEKLLSLEIPNSIKNDPDTSNKLDTNFRDYADSILKYEQENNPPFLTSDDLLNLETIPRHIKEKKIQDIFPQDSLESLQTNKWLLPDWLSQVSPNTETNLFEMSEKAENEIRAAEKKPITGDSIKLNLKEKSVEELLQLAEEVEKSFSQKAEQFESLESILQGELFSLEKDLEAVSDIHKILDDPLGLLDSYTSDEHLDIGDPKGIETNLMEFIDVPCKPQGQLQTSGYPPEVVVHLQNRIVQSGCRTRLYCSIMGDPDPEITWKKNKKPVPRSSRYMFGNLVEFGVYLDIYNAKSTDSGEYTCVATNCYGSAQTQSYLQVIGNREVSPEEPKFLKSPEDISCKSGETVTMEWKMAGTPMPHVMWFKNAERIETNLRMDTFSNHRGCCHLTVRNVYANDSAIYTCYLENDTGSAISTVQLSVEDLKTSNLQEVCKNQPLIDDETITCQIIPPPLPMEERNIDETSVRQKTKSYEKHFRRSEMEQDPIGPVIAAHVLSSGQTWTILTWCPPVGGRCRYEYLIERRLLNSDHWTEVGRTYNTLFTVHGLKKGRSYIFRVSAGNSRGWNFPVTMSQPVHAMPR